MQTKTKEITVDDANIEHVFPKSPSEEWTNKDKLAPLLWHIGNLTVLGKRLNKNAANKSFATKRTYYQANTELEITKELAAKYSEWNETSVRERGASMFDRVAAIWSFDNPSFA